MLDPLKNFEEKAQLADLPCLKLSMRGSGKQSEVQIKPEFIDFGGSILPHNPYEGKVTLTNAGEAPADVAWADVSSDEVSIQFAPMKGSIAPGASIEVAYCVEAHKLCRFNVNAPLMVEHGPEGGFLLNLAANVVGPSVKLDQAEIDFGLLGVRETKAQDITFTNMSNVAAEWTLREFVKGGKREGEVRGGRRDRGGGRKTRQREGGRERDREREREGGRKGESLEREGGRVSRERGRESL